MDPKEQLRHIVAQTKDALYSNLCKLKECMDAGTTALSNIADGAACKVLEQDGKVRWSDPTLTIKRDGGPSFKLTNASIWPIQFFVNELPFSSRAGHTVLAGLWFGHKHPDMLLFLSKSVEEVTAVGELMWKCGSAELRSKVYPVCVVLMPLLELQLGTTPNSMASLDALGAWSVKNLTTVSIFSKCIHI